MYEGHMADIAKTPDTTGLEVFTIEVDGNNLRWASLNSKDYAWPDRRLSVEDFEVRPGKRKVTCVLFPKRYFNQPTGLGVIQEIERRNLSLPDRATTETVLDIRKNELAYQPIASLCGKIRNSGEHDASMATVHEHDHGRDTTLSILHTGWGMGFRFLAVVSEEPIE